VTADAVGLETSASSIELARVAAAQAGDEAAYDALIRPRIRGLLRLSTSIMGSEPDGQDAVQDACLAAWRELPRLRDPERFDAWINRIVVNACRTRLRSRRTRQVREIPIDELAAQREPSSGQPLLGEDLGAVDSIRRAFDRLDADKRAILVLHHVERRSVADIGAVLGIPVGTAKWRLYAARGALERALREEAR
jgi:RNA polymerase sigma-70 factor, ECF subfamily